MFEHEDFEHFFAVDMAIRWWYELDDNLGSTGNDLFQPSLDDSVANESNRILEGITKQFNRPGGCKSFRRLFVLTSGQISNEKTRRALRIIEAQESSIRNRQIPGRYIESRFVNWDIAPLEYKNQLAILHDVACWVTAQDAFALIDRQIARPLDGEHMRTIPDREHSLCVERNKIGQLQALFLQNFDRAKPIAELWRPQEHIHAPSN
jgi:hypothetical protein